MFAFPVLVGTPYIRSARVVVGIAWISTLRSTFSAFKTADCANFDWRRRRRRRGQRIHTIERGRCAEFLRELEPSCPSLERVFPAPQGRRVALFHFRHRNLATRAQAMGLPTSEHHSARASFHIKLQASWASDVATGRNSRVTKRRMSPHITTHRSATVARL